ncbi:cell division protein PerM [Dactylosporangium sp. CS-033363]|uniref:cell division protein PerM n=1 Tax=Dactylosporangium sp. CS-033363 TaxID=3239935 RepID=UPI003D8A45FD
MPTTPTPEDPEEGAQTRLADRETVKLPIQRRAVRGKDPAKRPARRAPLALAAVVNSLWAALVSLVPTMLLVWGLFASDSSGTPLGETLRLGLAGWVLAHWVPLQTGIGPISLAPLGLTAVAAWRVYRAGVHTARAIGARAHHKRTPWSPWPAARAGLAIGIVYSALGTLAATLADHRDVDVSLVRAALTFGGFGLVAGSLGAFAEARGIARLAARTPRVLRDATRTGLVAALLVLGAGAATTGMAVAVSGGDASQIIDDYHTGIAGQIGLVIVCGFFAPDVAVWAASYLVGPGFTIGSETFISAAHVSVGTLPAVPLLAGLPSTPATGYAPLLLGLPLLAALIAGWLLARRSLRSDPERSWFPLLGAAVLAGPVAGVVLALVSAAAGGSLGADGLADIGPHAGAVGFVAMFMIAIGALLSTAATKLALRAKKARE